MKGQIHKRFLMAIVPILLSGCVIVTQPAQHLSCNHPACPDASQSTLAVQTEIKPYQPPQVTQGSTNMPGTNHSAHGAAGASQTNNASTEPDNMTGMDDSDQMPSTGHAMTGMDHGASTQPNTNSSMNMGNMQGMNHSQHQQASQAKSTTKEQDHSAHGMQNQLEAPRKPQAGHSHGEAHAKHSQGKSDVHSHGASAAGKPGVASKAARTIKVTALDTMRFNPETLNVKAGETVRFVVTNVGKIPHEFVIGTTKEQQEHEEMMKQMPNMKHEDANSITLAPGETKTLVWQFGKAGTVELGCHIPGHYPAGMRSTVIIGSGAAQPSKTPTKPSKPATMPGGMDHSQHQRGS